MTDLTADLPVRPRTLIRQLVHGVLGRWGARVGLSWVCVLVALAVFSPFIANSHPMVMKSSDGVISSPLLQHLTAADWTIFVAALGTIGVSVLRRHSGRTRLLLLAMIVGVAAGITYPLVQTKYSDPQAYRKGLAAGSIAWAMHVPIPFSPDDRQRDISDARNKPPSARHLLGTTGSGADLA